MNHDDLRAKAKAVSAAEDEVRSTAETPHEAIERQHALDIAEIEWHHAASPDVVLGLLDEIRRLRAALDDLASLLPPERWRLMRPASRAELGTATPLEGDPK